MSLLHLPPQSRDAHHDHLFYGSVTLALLILGAAASSLLELLVLAGGLGPHTILGRKRYS